ncbi:MAG: hypothetical protein HZB91_07510 [Elusimicrobia bacterium]|nr:hypothetical protein [Elusimicrobiota bacterium]
MASAVLVCAATGWEAGPLVSRLGLRSAGAVRPLAGPLPIVSGGGTPAPETPGAVSRRPGSSALFEGAVSGRPVLLLRTGMGAARTTRSLEAFDATGRVVPGGAGRVPLAGGGGSRGSVPPLSCVVSAGLACGLDPALSTGDLVVDLGPGGRTWGSAACDAAERRGLRLRLGSVAEAGSVLGPEAKTALRSSTGACAADMETRALRTWAEGRGLAVVNARVVLDGAGEELPAGFSDPDDPWALAGSVLRRPHLLPSLLRVGWKVRSGLAGLAGFLEEFLPRL